MMFVGFKKWLRTYRLGRAGAKFTRLHLHKCSMPSVATFAGNPDAQHQNGLQFSSSNNSSVCEHFVNIGPDFHSIWAIHFSLQKCQEMPKTKIQK